MKIYRIRRLTLYLKRRKILWGIGLGIFMLLFSGLLDFRDELKLKVVTFSLNKTSPKPYHDIDYKEDLQQRRLLNVSAKTTRGPRLTINLAAIACEGRGRHEALVMLKSALVFSQDAHLHLHIISDQYTLQPILRDLLDLKRITDALDWDFTFSLYPEWFPKVEGIDWRQMWQPCATQRLFFPVMTNEVLRIAFLTLIIFMLFKSLLHNVHSVIHINKDVIVLSSLKELWIKFQHEIQYGILAGMAPNTEYPANGHYSNVSKTPYYGKRGLNAGVMLMNLNGMRRFEMEARSLATQILYNDKIFLADQDVYNIIFHTYPERMLLLNCTYNFCFTHCGQGPKQQCYLHKEKGPVCFCRSAMTEGIKIVHGNLQTFSPKWPFLFKLHEGFRKLDILKDDPLILIETLMEKFDRIEETPVCFDLTSEAMYKNARNYLRKLRGIPKELR